MNLPNDPAPGEPMQFDAAEYSKPEARQLQCVACRQPLNTVYYEINGQIACEPCCQRAQAAYQGHGVARFFRALVLGVAAAVLGALVWYAIARLTGYELGLIAVLIGLFVGGAVRKGAGSKGGWLYQLLAILLTYLSIVSTYIPPILESIKSGRDAARADLVQAGKTEELAAMDAADDLPTAQKALGWCIQGVLILGFALALPFLSGAENMIGLLIIGFALYEAWKINKRISLVIQGPFQLAPAGAQVPPLPST